MPGHDRIEAAVRAGEVVTARNWLDNYEAWAECAGSPWARAVALHGRALLAEDDEESERLFEAALDMHAKAARPFERARIELAFGEFLRRARRPRDARRHLRAALDGFEALGAELWAEQARVELRARPDGASSRRRHSGPADRARAADRTLRSARPHQPRGRRAALPQPAHDRRPAPQQLPEARHQLAHGARTSSPRVRLCRDAAHAAAPPRQRKTPGPDRTGLRA
jgi:hypothetical protein